MTLGCAGSWRRLPADAADWGTQSKKGYKKGSPSCEGLPINSTEAGLSSSEKTGCRKAAMRHYFFAGAFLAAGFFAAGFLAAGFFAAAFFATGFFAAGFFAATFFAAGFLAAGFFAAVLVAILTPKVNVHMHGASIKMLQKFTQVRERNLAAHCCLIAHLRPGARAFPTVHFFAVSPGAKRQHISG